MCAVILIIIHQPSFFCRFIQEICLYLLRLFVCKYTGTSVWIILRQITCTEPWKSEFVCEYSWFSSINWLIFSFQPTCNILVATQAQTSVFIGELFFCNCIRKVNVNLCIILWMTPKYCWNRTDQWWFLLVALLLISSAEWRLLCYSGVE